MNDKTKSKKTVSKMTFEECFDELEDLVNKFEQGKMPLSESIVKFERGVELIKKCSEQLSVAEKKVEELLQKISPEKITGRTVEMPVEIDEEL